MTTRCAAEGGGSKKNKSAAIARAERATWFDASDSDRAWVEKFFLLYSPFWMIAIGLCMVLADLKHWSDVPYLVLGLAIALPPVLLPFRLAPSARAKVLAAKLNLWIWLFSFAGNYFFTRYFMDLLGLRYAYPTRLNLGAILVGQHRGEIPFLMFLLTQAYFLTYHALIFVAWRRAKRAWPVLIALACTCAFMETAAMASPLIADLFWYENKERMLTTGTLFYGSVFLISAPLLFRLKAEWPWSRVVLEALAACMIQFYVFELWAFLLK